MIAPGRGNPLFGDWGRAQRAAGACFVDTPTGVPCLGCEEPIRDGDAGELMPAIDDRGWRFRPFHRECILLGIAGHAFGVCACTEWAGQPTVRAAALEMVRRMEAPGAMLDLSHVDDECACDPAEKFRDRN